MDLNLSLACFILYRNLQRNKGKAKMGWGDRNGNREGRIHG